MDIKNLKFSSKGSVLAIILSLTMGFSLTACGKDSSKESSENSISTNVVDYNEDITSSLSDIDISGATETSEIEELNNEVYLSEDLYNALKNAIPATKEFLGDSSACDVMRNNGVNVPDEYVEKLNTVVPTLFKQYQEYVEAYSNGNYSCAVEAAKKIDGYFDELSYNDLYNITLKNNLSKDFSGEYAKVDCFGIQLDNNKVISAVYNDGGLFSLNSDECIDGFNKSNDVTKIGYRLDFYEKLPEMLCREYVPIRNTSSDSDLNVCYVWCEKEVDKILDKKIEQIKEDNMSLYPDINIGDCQVIYTNGRWCFVDNSGNLVGELDSMSSYAASSVGEVQDALDNNEGSVLRIGNILSSYTANSLENGYTYKND